MVLPQSLFHGVVQTISEYARHNVRPNTFAPTHEQGPQSQGRFDLVKGFFHAIFATIPADNGLGRQKGFRGIGLKTGHPKHALRRPSGGFIDRERNRPRLNRAAGWQGARRQGVPYNTL